MGDPGPEVLHSLGLLSQLRALLLHHSLPASTLPSPEPSKGGRGGQIHTEPHHRPLWGSDPRLAARAVSSSRYWLTGNATHGAFWRRLPQTLSCGTGHANRWVQLWKLSGDSLMSRWVRRTPWSWKTRSVRLVCRLVTWLVRLQVSSLSVVIAALHTVPSLMLNIIRLHSVEP